MSPMPAQSGARIGGRSWDLDATIDRPAGSNGVIYATGNQNSGLSLFIQSDHLVFDYNCFGEHHIAESDIAVPAGESVVGIRFRGAGGQRGHATLVIDGIECGQVEIPFVMLIISSVGPSVGFDHGSPVSRRYASPYAFEGTLDRVDITIVSRAQVAAHQVDTDGDQMAEADARQQMSRQ
jgi:arylsulfatase